MPNKIFVLVTDYVATAQRNTYLQLLYLSVKYFISPHFLQSSSKAATLEVQQDKERLCTPKFPRKNKIYILYITQNLVYVKKKKRIKVNYLSSPHRG